MAIIRWRPTSEWDPFSLISSVRDEMDRLFDNSLAPWRPTGAGFSEGAWTPEVDVIEDENSVIIRANIPGLKQDEIDLSVVGDTLTLKGEKKQESEVKKENYHRIERSYGFFQRVIPLPSAVDADKVKASYQDGVLEVELPKKEEAKPKKIDIKLS